MLRLNNIRRALFSYLVEQYYTSNVQRNQLVQKDIRVAKSLQDEEKHTARVLRQQTTDQL